MAEKHFVRQTSVIKPLFAKKESPARLSTPADSRI
jgi:hypothetical protein